MARIFDFYRKVRRVNGLTIYWADKKTVQVSTRNGSTVVFHRWFEPNSYERWKKFCDILRKNNSLDDIWTIMDIAHKYEVSMESLVGKPKRVPDDAIELPTHFKGM